MNTDKRRFPGGIRNFSATSSLLFFSAIEFGKKTLPHLRLSVFICGFSFFFFQRRERLLMFLVKFNEQSDCGAWL